MATKKDFERKNRQKLISKIATGDYDAVIISFSQFEKIPVSRTFLYNELDLELEILKEAISSLLLEDNNKVSVKRLETQKMKLEEEIESLENELNEQDDLIDFEDLGIDYLFVDEAHNYKNCYVYTKLSNVARVGTTRAKKSFDILMKTKYITEKNNGKGGCFCNRNTDYKFYNRTVCDAKISTT